MAKSKKSNKLPAKPRIYVACYDLHYPSVNWPTFNCMLSYIQQNNIDGFIFGGDQFDNQCISKHTKNKPIYRVKGAYRHDEEGFREKVFNPLADVFTENTNPIERVWIVGNHDDWEFQYVEENPEFEGLVDRVTSLKLVEQGWKVVPRGHEFRLGKLSVIHGEVLTGIGNQGGNYPARKAVELYASNVLAGHTHAPQSFTRVSPVRQVQKWMGHIAPIVGDRNPQYLQNRPTAWLNGFVIIEVYDNGQFNLFPVIVTNGVCSYGGKIYRAKK